MTATPAPIATPDAVDEAAFDADPSPVADPTVVFDDESVSAPPAVTVNPPGIVACAVELDTFTPIAAATEIGVDFPPLEAEADGAVELDPSTPDGASPLAKLCCPATCWSTSPDG